MTTAAQTLIPTGTWNVDAVHSTAVFSVGHAAVGTFRGQFRKIDGGIADGVLRGEVTLDTLDVFDDNLKGHLLSPDFFDAERNPKLTFVSTGVRADGENVIVEGDLTVRGVTKRVEATGTVTGPTDLGEYGGTKLGIDLEAAIDRTDFGLNWNALMDSGMKYVGEQVQITLDIEAIRQDAEAT